MNTKLSLTTLVAAATLAIAGVAVAQSVPITQSKDAPSSTMGAGCTATGNAMRAGNLGGDPQPTCVTKPVAAPIATITPVPAEPAPVIAAPLPAPVPPAPVAVAPMPAPAAPEPAPLVAKADRG